MSDGTGFNNQSIANRALHEGKPHVVFIGGYWRVTPAHKSHRHNWHLWHAVHVQIVGMNNRLHQLPAKTRACSH